MSTTPTPQVVKGYLAQLETALRGVEPGVRDEIVGGIREELDGLSATDAATRIDELGDPEFIAAEARAESEPGRELTGGRPLMIVAALLVMIGGIVVPLVGAVAGLVLVVLSPAWTRWQKVVAVVAPIAATIVISAIATFMKMWTDGVHGPGIDGYNDLLIPTAGDVFFNSLAFLVLFLFADGIWLLVVAYRNAQHGKGIA